MALPLSAHTPDSWQALQAQTTAPEWLQNWRALQLQEFLKRGFPKRRDESWKYTELHALTEQAFTLPKASISVAVQNLAVFTVADSYRMVFIDGNFSKQHSSLEDIGDQIILKSRHEMMRSHPEFYQQLHTQTFPSELSVFHWLNGAFEHDGLFLMAPDHCQLTKPLHLLYLSTNQSMDEEMRHPRHIIQLGANTCAVIFEEYYGLSGRYFNNVMTKITAGANSRLDYYKLQRESADAFHISNTLVEQDRDSRVRLFHIADNAKINREDLNVALRQSNANCELSGFYYTRAQRHIDFHTRIDHLHAHTHSRQHYKGMVAALGHGVFNGKIIVHPQAQHITAKQENHNLLLADSAEIDTKPELEVYADNVQCTHGATVGSLDPNALFYLRSRGVSEKSARNLLMHGFSRQILDHFPSRDIAFYIQAVMGDYEDE